MAAPFDFREVSSRVEKVAARLRSADDYREDSWSDSVLGPLLRVYVMLTHFPDEAFPEPSSAEDLAE